MFPNFFVVGAQKAGTTSLNAYLSEHPQIFVPQKKETKFFAAVDIFAKGLNYYQQFFADAHSFKAIGEIDPEYMFVEEALPRIIESIPQSEQLRFIFVLRDPVDRAFSHYLMTFRRGWEKLCFESAIDAEAERMKGHLDARIHFSYVSRGHYLQQIERFTAVICRKNMHFMLFEDLKDRPLECLRSLYAFLGVEGDFVPAGIGIRHHEATRPRSQFITIFLRGDSKLKRILRLAVPDSRLRDRIWRMVYRWNKSGGYKDLPQMSDRARRILAKAYLDERSKLEKLTGLDLSRWQS